MKKRRNCRRAASAISTACLVMGAACSAEEPEYLSSSNDSEVNSRRIWAPTWAQGTSDNFGHSVSIGGAGMRVLIGAPNDDTETVDESGNPMPIVDAGSARIYRWDLGQGSWKLEKGMSAGLANDKFGFAVSLSIAGDVAVIGAPWDDRGASDSGSAWFYRLDATDGWQFEAVLRGQRSGDQFGFDVALSGDGQRALIGARFADPAAGADAGSAYLYRHDGEAWVPEATFPGQSPSELAGYSVALDADGSLAFVGAPEAGTSAGVEVGRVHVYRRQDALWTPEPSLEGQIQWERFGQTIDIAGDEVTNDEHLLSIGSPDKDWVRLYRRDASGSWILEQELLAPAQDASQVHYHFGSSLALNGSGTRLLVGTNLSASTYDKVGSEWVRAWELPSSGWLFGRSVALSSDGGKALVGAPSDDSELYQNAGSAHLFEVPTARLSCNLQQVGELDIGSANLQSLAHWGDSLYAVDNPASDQAMVLLEVDPDTGAVRNSFEVPRSAGLEVDANSLYLAELGGSTIRELDKSTGAVVRSLDSAITGGSRGLALIGGSLFHLGVIESQGVGFAEHDVETGEFVSFMPMAEAIYASNAASDGSQLLFATAYDPEVTGEVHPVELHIVTPTGETVCTQILEIESPPGELEPDPYGLAASPTRLYVADRGSNTIRVFAASAP